MKCVAILTLITVGIAFGQGEIDIDVEQVSYSDPYDNNYPLVGYVSIPETTPAPAVVILVSNITC
jgi:hypothetical protein